MHVYKAEIDTCLYALNHSTLPTGAVWAMQEFNAVAQYYVSLSSGQVNYSINKGTSSGVVAVAALKQ